ncbi:MAG: XdhC family protein [Candidatus Aminicenantes bacterium]|nr:XdhC family protein [Candidatus Aminicenantes bacterium]
MERAYCPDKNSYLELLSLIKKKGPAALATIIEARGSTPQTEGASALFSGKGLMSGTIGGGVIEAEVLRRALSAIKRKKSGVFTFNLAHDASQEKGAICGGRLRILLETRPEKNEAAIRALLQSLRRRKPGVLATLIRKDPSKKSLDIGRLWTGPDIRPNALRGTPFSGFEREILRALQEKKPLLVHLKPGTLYLEPHFPLPRLVIAGAGHIGQAVAHLGKLLDFEVIVIDDRPEYANGERFPDADRIIVSDIGEAVRRFPLSSDTYIVIVTRGHARDEEALRACLKRRAGYIGMIGSRRKAGLLREKFLGCGWAAPAEFDKVHSPIGISINSQTVQEIAVSIAAELVSVRNRNQFGGKDPFPRAQGKPSRPASPSRAGIESPPCDQGGDASLEPSPAVPCGKRRGTARQKK